MVLELSASHPAAVALADSHVRPRPGVGGVPVMFFG